MNVPRDQSDNSNEPGAISGVGGDAGLGAKLTRVRRTYGMCGARVTSKLLLHRLLPSERFLHDRVQDVRAFDAEHGVETSAIVLPAALGITGASAEHAVEYSPTAVKSFYFMMRRIGIDPSRYVFVDIGCGKGLVMLLASDFRFQKVVGVEASAQLCEVARSNMAVYESPSQQCMNLELYEGDATAFPMPENNTVYYLCNPFGPVVLDTFLDRLEESLSACPRDVLLVYDYPEPAYPVLDRHPILRQVENYETISPDYTWCYYENATFRGTAE
ncbi:class I SAM-dependent methyltransferase [Ilumatobacter sp.]|uniref:class I SAM-dependent methyltransferase n=1 Tax=Ilumatobacter sp. TaxID=1967498 RepID=UPI003AF60688